MQLEGKLTLIHSWEHGMMKSVAGINKFVWQNNIWWLFDSKQHVTSWLILSNHHWSPRTQFDHMPGVSQTTLGNPGFLNSFSLCSHPCNCLSHDHSAHLRHSHRTRFRHHCCSGGGQCPWWYHYQGHNCDPFASSHLSHWQNWWFNAQTQLFGMWCKGWLLPFE